MGKWTVEADADTIANIEMRHPVLFVPERTCRIEMPIIDWETGETDFKCSECGHSDDPQMWAEVYRYCPNCGARLVNE